jgi:hypothetical protein
VTGIGTAFASTCIGSIEEPEPHEFKEIIKKIKDLAVLEHPDDAPAVIKAQQIIDGKVTEMTFNYIT